ncbi:PAS domain S-box protein [Methanoregula sp.]|uniref:PAS domain S-box protein n=1 Tax=Methanoregula sp. TaxID=2052170 RepID=UPI003566F8C0
MNPTVHSFRLAEPWWRGIILALSAGVILVTLWCLTHGITTIFMHIYYFPIVLLAYRYRWKGCGLAMLLSLIYLGLVIAFDAGEPDVILGAWYRFLVFVGIAAVIAFLSERLVTVQSDIKKMQQFQNSMIENASVLIAALAPDGTVLVWNDAAEVISGYKKAGVLGKRTIWRQLYPDTGYRNNVTVEIRRILAQDTLLEDFETEIRCFDGSSKTILWNTRSLRDDAGVVTGYIAIGRDISAQKTAESQAAESSRFLATMIDTLPMPIFFKDTSGKYLGCNPVFEEYIGIRKDLLIGKTAFDLSPPDLAERYTAADRQVFDTPVSQRYETQVRYADGSRHDVIFYKAPFFNRDGSVGGLIGAFIDITDRKATEDRIRELLRVQDEQIRIINTSPAISFLWRAEENWPVESVSENITQFGYTPDDFISGSILYSAVIHPEDLARVGEEVAYNSRHHIDEFTQEYRIFGKNHDLFWITDYTHIRRDDSGNISHYEGIILNITERRQAEEALRETNAYLRNLIDYANAPIIVWDPEFRITRFNHAFEHLTGRAEQEVLGQPLSLLFPEESRTSSLEQIQVTLAGIRWETVEIPILHVSGGIRAVLWNSATLYAEDGQTVIATIAQGQDITLRKRVEDALRESEQRNSAMVAAIPDILFVFSRDGTYLDFQAADENLLAISPDQILGKNVVDAGFDEDTAKAILEAISSALETGALQRFEYKHAVPAGMSWFEVRFVRLAADRVLGVVRNVTNIKSAEEALRNSRQFFMDIISFLPDPTFVIDKDGVVLAWNRALELLSGVPAGEIIGKGDYEYSLWLFRKRRPLLIDLVLTPDKDAARQNYLHITWDGTTVTAETEFLPSGGGQKIPLSLVASPLLDAQGNVTGAIESLRDISRLKEAEAELERFNANLEKLIQERTQALNDEIVQRRYAEQEVQDALSYTRSVIEANPDLMVVLDRAGRILDMNAAAESLTGLSREQMIGTPYSLYLVDNATPRDILDQLLVKGSIGYTVQLKRADGHMTPLSVNSTLFRGKDGAADARIIVAAHDITRQKEDEAMIRAALDEQVLLLREVHHRVKNNLQIIISLTNLQMRQTEDPRVRQVMAETQNRVRAMSLVHEKLYRSASLSHIDFSDYSRFLATQLYSSFGTDPGRVHLDFSMGKIMVDIVTAVPLGLLMNELITNALKHAFPQAREGTISISGNDALDHITLVVRDNGIGIPADFDWHNTTSLGMRLITSLVDQVDGTITLDRTNGTTFTITARRSPEKGGPV